MVKSAMLRPVKEHDLILFVLLYRKKLLQYLTVLFSHVQYYLCHGFGLQV